jgi:hypothetical protein
MMKLLFSVSALASLCACSTRGPAFPLHDVLWQDPDQRPVNVACAGAPSDKDPRHRACAPKPYRSSLSWDAADNTIFRPISEALWIETSGEAANVNTLDEVPDSSWFTNRMGARPVTQEELQRGACTPELLLYPEQAADASWVVDKGKAEGQSPGFRVVVNGTKYLLKPDDAGRPEVASAAQVLGLAIYHAVGFNTPCEQIVQFRPAILKLLPGLHYTPNLSSERPFDRATLDGLLARAVHRDGLVRMEASAWVAGYPIGPFRYEGTRDDDPNDVVDHEDRRELRGSRLLAAWIDRIDAREGNSLDVWRNDGAGPVDASPGHVVHYMLDTSESLAPGWKGFEEITRRAGYQYMVDWGDVAADFGTLGLGLHPWDTAHKAPGHERFWYFNAHDFVPERWRMEYPNPAFSRMTERDGAWMARLLARFTPPLVRTLAEMGQFSEPSETDYLAEVLEGRLQRILERYLTRLSSITDLTLDGEELCGVDLVEWRALRRPEQLHYGARWTRRSGLAVERRPEGRVCVRLPHAAPDGGPRDDAAQRYAVVTIEDGVSRGPLRVHLYDLGPARGYRLVGLERPAQPQSSEQGG